MAEAKKWYVCDKADCWDSYDNVQDAAKLAESLVGDYKGVHIVHMTAAQISAYCKHGDLKAAWAAK